MLQIEMRHEGKSLKSQMRRAVVKRMADGELAEVELESEEMFKMFPGH